MIRAQGATLSAAITNQFLFFSPSSFSWSIIAVTAKYSIAVAHPYFHSQWCPKTSSFVFGRTKKFIQVWNYLRVSKWWQNFQFWVNYPFKGWFAATIANWFNCFCPFAAPVWHGLSDPVQYQLHLITHPPLQSDGAAHQHGHPQTWPYSLQVRNVWVSLTSPLSTPMVWMWCNNHALNLKHRFKQWEQFT